MIVYAETNFVFEQSFLRSEHFQCEELLEMAKTNIIDLVIPAYSLVELYETCIRRKKARVQVTQDLLKEIGELSRSEPYMNLKTQANAALLTLDSCNEEEQNRLNNVVSKLANQTRIISLTEDNVKAAIKFQADLGLSPQDAFVFSSVVSDLKSQAAGPKCFVTQNKKDFANPDVEVILNSHECKLFVKFEPVLRYVKHTLNRS